MSTDHITARRHPPEPPMTPERKLWKIDDGERYWIMAPTAEQALALWWDTCADGHDEDDPPKVTEVTEQAATIPIRGDEGTGPPRSARAWMDMDHRDVAVIGSSVW